MDILLPMLTQLVEYTTVSFIFIFTANIYISLSKVYMHIGIRTCVAVKMYCIAQILQKNCTISRFVGLVQFNSVFNASLEDLRFSFIF